MTDATISMLVSQLGNAGARIPSNKPGELNQSGLPDFGNILSNAGKKNLEFKVEDRGASQSWMKKNEANYSNTAASSDSSKVKEMVSAATNASEVTETSDDNDVVTGAEPAEDEVKEMYSFDSDSETAVEEIADCLVYLASQMMTILTEQFNVSEEQVNTALEKNGYLITDLLDSTKLSDMFIELSGKTIEPVDVVSDENFTNLTSKFNDIVKEVFGEGTFDISELMSDAQKFVDAGIINKEFTELVLPDQVDSDDDIVPEMLEDNTNAAVAQTANTHIEDTVFDNDEIKNLKVKTETAVTNEKKDAKSDEVNENEDVDDVDDFTPDWLKPRDYVDPEEKFKKFIAKRNNGGLGLKDDDPIVINHNPENTLPTGELPVVEIGQVVNRLTDYIEIMSRDNKITEISFQLNPANLGKVTVEVATKDGVVSAKVIAQTEAAKSAIEANLAQLKTNLEQQGVRISDVEVTVESHAFEQNLQQQGSKEQEQLAKEMQEETKKNFRSINGINLNELDLNGLRGLMSEEDIVVAKMMMDNGNVLNIKA